MTITHPSVILICIGRCSCDTEMTVYFLKCASSNISFHRAVKCIPDQYNFFEAKLLQLCSEEICFNLTYIWIIHCSFYQDIINSSKYF
jgi:hypothetical protein